LEEVLGPTVAHRREADGGNKHMSWTEEVHHEVRVAQQELEQAERSLERSTEACRTRYENALHNWELACRRADLLARRQYQQREH
jgi:hypothetical protein